MNAQAGLSVSDRATFTGRAARPLLILVASMLVASAGFLGCGKKEAEPSQETAVAEQQARREAEAAAEENRRRDRVAELQEQVAQLKKTAETLPTTVADSPPVSIEERIGDVTGSIGESEELLAQLESAPGEDWEAARGRLETALAELRKLSDQVSGEVQEWQRREAEAVAGPGEGQSPVNPETGLIEGLDGGDYDQYAVFMVERVQRELRRRGFYAGPVDSYFDVATMKAVGRFQEEHELQVSGVPSPMTRARLFADEP